MVAHRFLTPVMILAAMVVWVATAQSAEIGSTKKCVVYENLLMRYAANCEKLARFGQSKSNKLRHTAEIACLKAAYLNQYKSQIITTLMEKNVEPKPYKIQYIVNNLFYDLIRRTAQPRTIPSGLIAREK